MPEDTVDPPFHDRRHAEPPQGKLKHDDVGPQQLLLFLANVSALRAGGISLALRPVVDQALPGVASGKILGVRHRLEAHRVKIRDAHLVPAFPQGLHGAILERSIQRARIGVRIDDEVFHNALLKAANPGRITEAGAPALAAAPS